VREARGAALREDPPEAVAGAEAVRKGGLGLAVAEAVAGALSVSLPDALPCALLPVAADVALVPGLPRAVEEGVRAAVVVALMEADWDTFGLFEAEVEVRGEGLELGLEEAALRREGWGGGVGAAVGEALSGGAGEARGGGVPLPLPLGAAGAVGDRVPGALLPLALPVGAAEPVA